MAIKKLTTGVLVKMIREERAKFLAEKKAKKGKSKFGKMQDAEAVAKKTKEVDADKYADTVPEVEKHIKEFKRLKEEERRLVARLKEVSGKKRRIMQDL
jgi:hypothetical protein